MASSSLCHLLTRLEIELDGKRARYHGLVDRIRQMEVDLGLDAAKRDLVTLEQQCAELRELVGSRPEPVMAVAVEHTRPHLVPAPAPIKPLISHNRQLVDAMRARGGWVLSSQLVADTGMGRNTLTGVLSDAESRGQVARRPIHSSGIRVPGQRGAAPKFEFCLKELLYAGIACIPQPRLDAIAAPTTIPIPGTANDSAGSSAAVSGL